MNSFFSLSRVFFSFSLLLLLAAPVCIAQPVGLSGASITTHFNFPVAADAALVGFDWDASGTLHYTVGDPNWGFKNEVYKSASPTDIQVHQAADVFVGSRLTCIGDYMYFNDGGDYMRAAFNYFLYTAATADTPISLLTYPYGANLWGLATRNAGGFFASGSEADWGPAALFYNTLDASGTFAGTLSKFADLGESPGPLTFDSAGSLYYVPGYVAAGATNIYRWNAADVAAALADPATASLTASGNEWVILPSPYNGATGIAVDGADNIYVSATAFGEPSQLLFYNAASLTMSPVVEYTGRLETVRPRGTSIYFSAADGVFELPLPQVIITTEDTEIHVQPMETALFSVEVIGGIGTISYQWYRVTEDKALVPVGSNVPVYSMIALPADSGAEFYCAATDDTGTVESLHFILVLDPPVPASTVWTLLIGALSFIVFGVLYTRRQFAPVFPQSSL
ncbi:MAG: hypothetical protein KAH38_00040 [Candidatus Hydrogenedentes bacterium]|nr:hypothetical protein [Candidatus Hydrogenedentota bacterium]